MTFERLKRLSFLHSAIYFALLIVWVVPGLKTETRILGWAHGVMWILMSVLVIVAMRRRIVPFWLAVTVAVVGGLGPFAGSYGFVIEERRRATSTTRAY